MERMCPPTPAPEADKSSPVALAPPGAVPADENARAAPTRVSASWTAVVLGVVILILLIIFVAENTKSAQVNFLGVHGRAPTAVVLLIAAVAGAVIVVAVAASRILQLRKRAKRVRRTAS
jgi:uncharacterized integral membrane protein